MNTFAEVPSGRRMPARVMVARCAAFVMICVTSAAVRRLAPPMNCRPGTVEIGSSMKWIAPPMSVADWNTTGPRNSPVTPPSCATGYGYGGGGAWIGKPSTMRPGRLPSGMKPVASTMSSTACHT